MNAGSTSESELLIAGSGPVDFTIDVPGSKSIANRALVLASLAEGRSVLSNVPTGDDVAAMKLGLRALGVVVDGDGDRLIVTGPLDLGRTQGVDIDARLAGTTSRFLIAVAALCAGRTTITGEQRLRERPFGELVDALRQLGATIVGGPGLPLSIERGELRGGTVAMSGEISSQFVSALMMIAPRLAGGVRINLSGHVVSASYVAMTASLMSQFGVNARFGGQSVEVGEGDYRATEISIEPDASSASYPAALAAIAGGSVRIRRAATVEMQADRVIFDILRQMGTTVRVDDGDVVVGRSPGEDLRAIDVDLRDASDLVPTVAALAATARGRSRIRGVGFVRNKESDRIGDLATELRKFGIEVTEDADGLDVVGGSIQSAIIDPHHDHRLAMALALLGRVAAGTRVRSPEVVGKSWPRYFVDMGLDR